MRFSEITSRSFRATWTPPPAAVLSYLVRFRKAEDVSGDYISLIVPGNTPTSILPNLYPITTYEVNVFSQYDKGDSFSLTGEETTLEGKTFALIGRKNSETGKEFDIYFMFLLQSKARYGIYGSQRKRQTVSGCHGRLLQVQ